jgi:hypothetical protein
MTTLSTMLSDRDTAGARYAAALTELRAGWIDLAAYDWAIQNCLVGVASPQDVEQFGGDSSVPQAGVPDQR